MQLQLKCPGHLFLINSVIHIKSHTVHDLMWMTELMLITESVIPHCHATIIKNSVWDTLIQ